MKLNTTQILLAVVVVAAAVVGLGAWLNHMGIGPGARP